MTTSPDKLSVILYTGAFDKVHYGLAIASAGAAVGKAVTLFFTMDACRALGDGEAWAALPLSEGEESAKATDDRFKKTGVGDFETLLSACVELGVTFMVCEMGLRARGLEGMAFRTDVPIQEGGLVTFLSDASQDGAMLLI